MISSATITIVLNKKIVRSSTPQTRRYQTTQLDPPNHMKHNRSARSDARDVDDG